jgi:hypothetical protein
VIESHIATKPTDDPRIGGRNESWQINFCPKANTLSSTCFFFGLAHWFLLLWFYEGVFSRKACLLERGRKMDSHPPVGRAETYSRYLWSSQSKERTITLKPPSRSITYKGLFFVFASWSTGSETCTIGFYFGDRDRLVQAVLE